MNDRASSSPKHFEGESRVKYRKKPVVSEVSDPRCRFAVASSTQSRCSNTAAWSCPDETQPMWCGEHRHDDDVAGLKVPVDWAAHIKVVADGLEGLRKMRDSGIVSPEAHDKMRAEAVAWLRQELSL